ncbi:MAG TPA: PAS domain-containing protein [Candidatus Edwardsbacteria bacterium]|nr:PAS domain-containing protein [Candidatus Edwardsbacteria bacterium]
MPENFPLERMSREMTEALFEAVPQEITVIDRNDEVVGWNKHATRLFPRPMGSMGVNIRHCHPERSLDKVLAIVGEMRTGKRDKARFWIDLPIGKDRTKHKVMIEFYALRDKQGNYLGCMECTQDVEEIRQLEGEQRLLS